jgi:16S rRNA (guanine966-N2)-methyltransferase
MRIISGKYKGRVIPVRKNFSSRPTTDFAKENLFNVLNNFIDFEDLEVLDLFSGTGSISFEFASRDGKRIVSVENDFTSFNFIQTIVKNIGITTIEPVKMDVFKYLKKSQDKFDLVFADPPYDLKTLSDLPEKVLSSTILKNEGWLILEHGKNNQFSEHQQLIDKRVYGSVHFSIFQKK